MGHPRDFRYGLVLDQSFVLAAVGIGIITPAVYGVVALIVKADDIGVVLTGGTGPGPRPRAGDACSPQGPERIRDRGMLWVGGGIIMHGPEEYGSSVPGHAVHAVAETASHALPATVAGAEWLVSAAAAGVFGPAVGGGRLSGDSVNCPPCCLTS